MVFKKLLLENALAIRTCSCEAASEPLLPKVARCIPVLPSRYIGKCTARVLREVSFFTGRGAPENWGGIRYFFVDQKRGSKDFFKLKRGSLIFFKEIRYFVKHFRTQMEFLLILQKRCSFESVSCWNSSKRG